MAVAVRTPALILLAFLGCRFRPLLSVRLDGKAVATGNLAEDVAKAMPESGTAQDPVPKEGEKIEDAPEETKEKIPAKPTEEEGEKTQEAPAQTKETILAKPMEEGENTEATTEETKEDVPAKPTDEGEKTEDAPEETKDEIPPKPVEGGENTEAVKEETKEDVPAKPTDEGEKTEDAPEESKDEIPPKPVEGGENTEAVPEDTAEEIPPKPADEEGDAKVDAPAEEEETSLTQKGEKCCCVPDSTGSMTSCQMYTKDKLYHSNQPVGMKLKAWYRPAISFKWKCPYQCEEETGDKCYLKTLPFFGRKGCVKTKHQAGGCETLAPELKYFQGNECK